MLGGQRMDLVRTANGWVARQDDPQMVVRDQGDGTWIAFDGRGWKYVFAALSPSLSGSGLWHLASITGPGGNSVTLTYTVGTTPISGASDALSVDLTGVQYNPDGSGCFKSSIALRYETSSSAPLAVWNVGTKTFTRNHVLSSIEVLARRTQSGASSCSAAPERLRRYDFAYDSDVDTKLPRLMSVQVMGQHGTDEETVALPVARFAYGSASAANKLSYARAQSIQVLNAFPLASTELDATPHAPDDSGFFTKQGLLDFNGDGRPDLVSGAGVALSSSSGSGGTIRLGGVNNGPNATAMAPIEKRSTHGSRYNGHNDVANDDTVWRRAIDINGDGRVDIIDASEQPGKWVVYLNTPDAADPLKISMQRRTISTVQLTQQLRQRGIWSGDAFLPLSLRTTARERDFTACVLWNGSRWVPFEDETTHFGCAPGGNVTSTGPETTISVWDLEDINGDGYPDLVLNSSGLHLDEVYVLPPPPSSVSGTPVHTTRTERYAFSDGAANQLLAMFNILGVHSTAGDDEAFASPTMIRPGTQCGVSRWTKLDTDHQQQSCGFADVNGDGLPDFVDGTSVYLGTGSVGSTGWFMSGATITLPGPTSVQKNSQETACAPPATGDTKFAAFQAAGLRDLTGDGVPDYVSVDTANHWSVAVGTGAGFAAAIPIVGTFALSVEEEDCLGHKSSTTSGLFDMDGDGKADLVSSKSDTPNSIFVDRLVGSGGMGAVDAGRVIQIENGYGAKTLISYRSAKEDATTLHQVPFSEIVVASVQTTASQGLAPTLYAYGGAEQVFDPAQDTFTFRGYRRTVELRIPIGESQGIATLSDTYGPARAADPFGLTTPGGVSASTTATQRYRTYLTTGRPSDLTVISGALGSDPGALLAINIATDTRTIGGTHYEWDVRALAKTSDPGGPEVCSEMVFPYDALSSALYSIGHDTYDVCAAHGFSFGKQVSSWRGAPGAAPPAAGNVETRSEIRSVDDFGRVLLQAELNDVHRTDDDLCVETTYATPTGTNERVLSAIASKRVTDCGTRIYASDSTLFDQLSAGSVSKGFPTSHSVERRDSTGGLISTIREFDTTYDTFGNPLTLSMSREDGATRAVRLVYDSFSMVPTDLTTTATGITDTHIHVTRDPLTLAVTGTTDPNGTQTGTTYDGFDRVVLTTVVTPDGVAGAMSARRYHGFAIGETGGRSIEQTVFTDPVPVDTALLATGRTSVVHLDDLGRQIYAEVALGSDYAGQTVTAGYRNYDSFGRVVFQADPFPSTQAVATAYGTTRFFNADGTPSCAVRANGRRSVFTNVTDEAHEVYPTCFSRGYQNNTEVSSVQDASSLLAGSPQFGVLRSSYATAVGRVIARSSWLGSTRLEHATFTYDGLGHVSGMTRYQTPTTPTQPVRWSWEFDSLGQITSLFEQGTSLQTNVYSNWGELLSVTRHLSTSSGSSGVAFVVSPASTPPPDDPPPPGPGDLLATVKRYDALGRLTHSEQQFNGVADPATKFDYLYDLAVALAPQVRATNMVGRLAQAISPTSAVGFSYDGLGQVNARVFTDPLGSAYVEKHVYHADGSPRALDLFLPDTGYAEEHFEYAYDSAGRGTKVTAGRDANAMDLFSTITGSTAPTIDALGRVRQAHYGEATYNATYADVGRRLISQASVTSASGSRVIAYTGFDPLGRERARTETRNNGAPSTTTFAYDFLGRLASATSSGAALPFDQRFTYDPLGNITSLSNIGGAVTSMSYGGSTDADLDRVCQILYGAGNGDKTCNVTYDDLGNIIQEPTATGSRQLTFFADGNVRSVAKTDSSGTSLGSFRYDALGELQELDVTSSSSPDVRQDRHYGDLLVWRKEASGSSVLYRTIPGPAGFIATRHGSGNDWVFEFGESRGARFFTDRQGVFVQDVDYTPYGEAKSSGAQPGDHLYSTNQWNGGDALAALGLHHLGARLYDPALGRFLSRDPLLATRTATTSNPYSFANNDPVNLSDPTGLTTEGEGDPRNGGQECVVCENGPANPIGPKLRHVWHHIEDAASTVGGWIEDGWNAIFGGGDSAPPPIDPTQARTLMRTVVIPAVVFAPGGEHYVPPYVREQQDIFDADKQIANTLRAGLKVAKVVDNLSGPVGDVLLDAAPLIGTYRAYERGDWFGFGFGLVTDIVFVSKIAKVVRVAVSIEFLFRAEANTTVDALRYGAKTPGKGVKVNLDLIKDEVANDLIPGKLKRSTSYASELASNTVGELIEISQQGGELAQKARKMLKLIKDEGRLVQKL